MSNLPARTGKKGADQMDKFEPPIHPLQAMVNGMTAAWQSERSKTQMTLGQLIEVLVALPVDSKVTGLGRLMSYRGYYSDLAFDPDLSGRTVGDLLAECRHAMGRIFEGYKGGDFRMGEDTPIWVSPYGHASGLRLMGLDIAEVVTPVLVEEVWP